jgi:hypothetical protein
LTFHNLFVLKLTYFICQKNTFRTFGTGDGKKVEKQKGRIIVKRFEKTRLTSLAKNLSFGGLAICILKVQVDLVICGIFVCKFVYLQLKIDHFSEMYPPNLQSILVFLFANLLYSCLIFWSLCISYNEVHLYVCVIADGTRWVP